MTKRYFQFPLFMLNRAHTDFQNSMQDIINFAIVDHALKQKVSIDDVARELMYSYFRDKKNTYTPAADLFKKLAEQQDEDSLEWFSEDYIIFGADNGKVQDNRVQSFVNELETEPELLRLATINCQLRKVNNFFGITGPDCNYHMKEYNRIAMTINQYENKHGKDARPTIETELFFDLLNKDQDPELFAAYMAIRSVEGQRNFAATNRPIIAGRMSGAKSQAVIKDKITIQGKARKVYEKYHKRYHFDKMLERLSRHGLVKSVLRRKHTRYIYLSTRLNPQQLGEAVAEREIKRKMKHRNNEALKAFEQRMAETAA